LQEIIGRNVICNFDVNSQGKNTYNFDNISAELAKALFINKRPLDYENIDKMQYQFELLTMKGQHSNLLSLVRNQIPQVPLTNEQFMMIEKYMLQLNQVKVH
jgi:hypothetical protein